MREDPAAEPALEQYRDAVALLHLDGAHVGYLATKVESMRGCVLLRRHAWVWFLLTRLDGSRDPIQGGYPPWTYIRELQEGYIDWTSHDGNAYYEVQWLEGDERRDAWERYGIVKDVGAYMGSSR